MFLPFSYATSLFALFIAYRCMETTSEQASSLLMFLSIVIGVHALLSLMPFGDLLLSASNYMTWFWLLLFLNKENLQPHVNRRYYKLKSWFIKEVHVKWKVLLDKVSNSGTKAPNRSVSNIFSDIDELENKDKSS